MRTWRDLAAGERQEALSGMTWNQRRHLQACLDLGIFLPIGQHGRPVPLHRMNELRRIEVRKAQLEGIGR
jgi:hypothetical protein